MLVMRVVLRLIVSAAAIFGVAYVTDGTLLRVDSFVAALWAAVVLGLVNVFIAPVVKVLSFPVRLLTFGLFSLVVNGLLLALVAAVVPGVDLVGWWQTVVAAALIAVVVSVLSWILERER